MPSEKIKIAIADSHAITRHGMRSFFVDNDFEVCADASNGNELVNMLSGMQLTPDVCVLDLNMPKLNGYETIKAINNKWPLAKTIVFTSFFSEYSLIKTLMCGGNGYVLKSAELSELNLAVNEVHTKGAYFSKWERENIQFFKKAAFKKYMLSDRELRFLQHACSEMTYKEIADVMCVSPHAIDGYRDELFHKLNIKSRVGLVLYAINSGIFIPPAVDVSTLLLSL